MTSQVVLYNKLGVAIASDSAVTSFRGKVLMGAEKIFELKPPHKLAILVSGSASFMRIPWEVIFSAWSETVHTPLQSLDDYFESLSRSLKTVVQSVPEWEYDPEWQYIDECASRAITAYRKIFHDTLTPFYKSILSTEDFELFRESEWTEEFRAKMTDLLQSEVIATIHTKFETLVSEHRNNYGRAENVSDIQALAWVNDYMNNCKLPIDDFYLSDWPVIPEILDFAQRLIATYIVHPDSSASDICLVGYGTKYLFPSLYLFTIHGALGGSLLITYRDYWKPDGYSQRLFLGQHDAISSLFIGEDTLLTQTALTSQDRGLMELSQQLASMNDESARLVNEFAERQRENLGMEMNKVGSERRGHPFLRAIGLAPVLDLAEFASQLVGIQSAYSAMNHDNPTVGGSIDVAVITHRDGFQWIRQKSQ